MANVEKVKDIMLKFSDNTGLDRPSTPPRRYLWTDAFATCNFLELYKQTGEQRFKEAAATLAEQVHHKLGRHRSDDKEGRSGWLSGLDEETGKLHPTSGGLRIGKKWPERLLQETFDEEEEWDREGQYFHYLTKWMQALMRLSEQTGDHSYLTWSIEMARKVHSKFVYSRGRTKRMYWKMSVDLSRPQVPSMGQHDPLDGYLTYHQLQVAARDEAALREQINDVHAILVDQDLYTTDPLGIGGLLCDSLRAFQIYVSTKNEQVMEVLTKVMEAAWRGLKEYNQRRLGLPAEQRLAFRELGLSIGLQAAWQLKTALAERAELSELNRIADRILEYHSLVDVINQFWSKDRHQKASTWVEHLDINMVMLATGLLPQGYLGSH